MESVNNGLMKGKKDIDINLLEKVLELYLEEWKHRDTTYIKYMFTFFWASIIVSIFPYIDIINNSLSGSLPNWLFLLCGFGLALVSFFTMKRLGEGVIRVREKYNELLTIANPDYRHKPVKDENETPMASKLPLLLLLVVGVMDAILFITTYI